MIPARKPIVKHISLKSLYQMNPTKFVLDMLKRIESRNDIKVTKNREGKDVTLYGVTDRENNIIELFKSGNLNPRAFSTKNEEIDKSIKEGLNLPKKVEPVKNIPKRTNDDVITHFFEYNINPKIRTWGTLNLKIVHYPGGWGLVNYKTLLAWRTMARNFYINNQKYSSSTTRIQSTIRWKANEVRFGEVHYVNEEEIYNVAGIENQTQDYPWEGQGRMWEMVQAVVNKKIQEGLNLQKRGPIKLFSGEERTREEMIQVLNKIPMVQARNYDWDIMSDEQLTDLWYMFDGHLWAQMKDIPNLQENRKHKIKHILNNEYRKL